MYIIYIYINYIYVYIYIYKHAKAPDFPTLRRVPSASRDSWPPAISTLPSLPGVVAQGAVELLQQKMVENHGKTPGKWRF